MKFINPKKVFTDIRGSIQELTARGLTLSFIECAKGSVRGGHYHKKRQELMILISGLVRLSIAPLKGKSTDRPMLEGCAVVIDPFEVHTITALRDSILLKIELPGDGDRQEDTYKA